MKKRMRVARRAATCQPRGRASEETRPALVFRGQSDSSCQSPEQIDLRHHLGPSKQTRASPRSWGEGKVRVGRLTCECLMISTDPLSGASLSKPGVEPTGTGHQAALPTPITPIHPAPKAVPFLWLPQPLLPLSLCSRSHSPSSAFSEPLPHAPPPGSPPCLTPYLNPVHLSSIMGHLWLSGTT